MSRYAFYSATLIICLVYGMAAEKYRFFPAPLLHSLAGQAKLAVNELRGDSNTWYYVDAADRQRVAQYQPGAVQPGLTMTTGIGPQRTLAIKIIDFQGNTIHQWAPDWHKIWPDASHLRNEITPRGKPGTHIHGSKLMANGDVVFNFENIGLIRLDVCGNTVFRVPYPTHHAIEVSENGDLWLPGQINHQTPLAAYPNYQVPFKDDTVVKISAAGKVLREISIMALLKDNGYEGLMYLSTVQSRNTRVSGDIYHLNDVEVFPSNLAEGVFKHGDIMVSLRNINTVLVFDPQSLKIRYLTTGKFVRQHDPDFIDGNHFSVFDNNHTAPAGFANRSKIVIVSALDDRVSEYFSGNETIPFYSNIMGKHQWLANGNLLVVESMNGRTFEINRDQQLVWEYNNLIEQTTTAGIMEGSERLGAEFDAAFFARRLAACQH